MITIGRRETYVENFFNGNIIISPQNTTTTFVYYIYLQRGSE